MTIYDHSRAEFSNKAHNKARSVLYPTLFKTTLNNLAYHSTLLEMGGKEQIMDAEMGIDVLVEVTVYKLREPLKFVFQERWREPKYRSWQDLTITEWNHASNLPSELYKITAGMFLYGYYDLKADLILEALVINVPALLYSIVTKSLQWKLQFVERKRQTFLYFTFKDLYDANLVMYHLKDNQVIYSISKQGELQLG